jgi:hypothetical protein
MSSIKRATVAESSIISILVRQRQGRRHDFDRAITCPTLPR